jgi:hypothetical protein
MKKILIAAFFIPVVANAAQWVEISNGSTAVVRVDTQSVVSLNGTTKKAWLEFVYPQARQTDSGKWYKKALTQLAFDCSKRATAALQDVLYESSAGNVVESSSIPKNQILFIDVVPESFAEEALNLVCKKK